MSLIDGAPPPASTCELRGALSVNGGDERDEREQHARHRVEAWKSARASRKRLANPSRTSAPTPYLLAGRVGGRNGRSRPLYL